MKKRLFSSRDEIYLVACMPKSASTFLTNLMAELYGLRKKSLTYAFGRSEQNLYLPAVVDNFGSKVVSQVHLRAAEANLEIMRGFGLRIVVLTRNIFDTVYSLRDHARRESPSYAMAYLDERHLELDEQRQVDMIIDLAMPWYFNFFVSWYEAAKQTEVQWVRYEDLVTDTQGTLRSLSDSLDKKVFDERIVAAIEKVVSGKSYRFNKGVVGRGYNMTDEQKGRVRALASYYPWVDFSPIGL